MRMVAVFFSVFCFVITLKYDQVLGLTKADIVRQTKFSPCKACKTFVESFQRGMDKTAKGKFEGGDAAWEEEKLRRYAQSEIRLVEIQEGVCSDIERGRDQCYALNEEYDGEIEEWWLNHQEKEPDLFRYLCVDRLQICCPDFHYGPDCKPCRGFPDHVCNNNGQCKGGGTRKGNGECICNKGHIGEDCEKCAEKYFETYKDDKTVLCSKCHHSCSGSCSKAGATGCEKCADGYLKNAKKGCLDVDECAAPQNVCTAHQFCVNTDGSYKCLECDVACESCTGEGPDMCIDCADGFNLVDNICIDDVYEVKEQYAYLMRCLTYLGLCVAVFILLKRSIVLAAVIGVSVVTYISLSVNILDLMATNATDIVVQLN